MPFEPAGGCKSEHAEQETSHQACRYLPSPEWAGRYGGARPNLKSNRAPRHVSRLCFSTGVARWFNVKQVRSRWIQGIRYARACAKGGLGVCSWKRIAAPRRRTACTTSTTCRETRKGLPVRLCCLSSAQLSMNRTSRAASGRSRHVTCAGTPSRPPRTSSPRLSEILAGYLPRVQRSLCRRI